MVKEREVSVFQATIRSALCESAKDSSRNHGSTVGQDFILSRQVTNLSYDVDFSNGPKPTQKRWDSV